MSVCRYDSFGQKQSSWILVFQIVSINDYFVLVICVIFFFTEGKKLLI